MTFFLLRCLFFTFSFGLGQFSLAFSVLTGNKHSTFSLVVAQSSFKCRQIVLALSNNCGATNLTKCQLQLWWHQKEHISTKHALISSWCYCSNLSTLYWIKKICSGAVPSLWHIWITFNQRYAESLIASRLPLEYIKTRSLEALRAPTFSWRPCRLLFFVLRSFSTPSIWHLTSQCSVFGTPKFHSSIHFASRRPFPADLGKGSKAITQLLNGCGKIWVPKRTRRFSEKDAGIILIDIILQKYKGTKIFKSINAKFALRMYVKM